MSRSRGDGEDAIRWTGQESTPVERLLHIFTAFHAIRDIDRKTEIEGRMLEWLLLRKEAQQKPVDSRYMCLVL